MPLGTRQNLGVGMISFLGQALTHILHFLYRLFFENGLVFIASQINGKFATKIWFFDMEIMLDLFLTYPFRTTTTIGMPKVCLGTI